MALTTLIIATGLFLVSNPVQTEPPAQRELTRKDILECASYQKMIASLLEVSRPEDSKIRSYHADRWIALIQKVFQVKKTTARIHMLPVYLPMEKKMKKFTAGDEVAKKELINLGVRCAKLQYWHMAELNAAENLSR